MNWDIQEHDLDGIGLITSRAAAIPTVQMRVRIKAGSFDEYPDHPPGTAHFFEHLPFEGTKNYPGRSFAYAAKIDGSLNAVTDYDCTDYVLDVPKKYWREGLKLLADIAQNATLDVSEIAQERRTIYNEKRSTVMSRPLARIDRAMEKAVYGGDNRFNAIIGTKESILSMTKEDLITFRDRFYVRENCEIAISGDLGHAEMKAAMQEAFASMPHGSTAPRQPFISAAGYAYELYPAPEYEHTRFTITFPLDPKTATPKSQMIGKLLARYIWTAAGPVMRDMRDEKHMVYAIGTPDSWRPDVANMGVSLVCDPGEVDDYVQKITTHLMHAVKGEIDSEAFALLKSNYVAAKQGDIDTGKYPAVDELLDQKTGYGRIAAPQERLHDLDSITLDDVVNFARDMMGRPPVFFAYGQTEGIMPQERFEEIVKPLTQAAQAYRAAPRQPRQKAVIRTEAQVLAA